MNNTFYIPRIRLDNETPVVSRLATGRKPRATTIITPGQSPENSKLFKRLGELVGIPAVSKRQRGIIARRLLAMLSRKQRG